MLIGQPNPSIWMSYLAFTEDDLIMALLEHDRVEVLEKKVAKGTSTTKNSGQIYFEDGMVLKWYMVSGGYFLYFENETGRVGYEYIPLKFLKRRFNLLDERKYPPKGDKSLFVSKFDPWADLTKHFELSKDYMDKVGPEMAPPPNESPFRKDPAKMIAGCVFVLAIAFVLFLIFFLFVN